MASLQTSGFLELGVIPNIWNIQLFFSWYLEMPSRIQKVHAIWKHFEISPSIHSAKVGRAPSTEFSFFSPFSCVMSPKSAFPFSLLNQNLKSKSRNSWGLNPKTSTPSEEGLPDKQAFRPSPSLNYQWTWGGVLPVSWKVMQTSYSKITRNANVPWIHRVTFWSHVFQLLHEILFLGKLASLPFLI